MARLAPHELDAPYLPRLQERSSAEGCMLPVLEYNFIYEFVALELPLLE